MLPRSALPGPSNRNHIRRSEQFLPFASDVPEPALRSHFAAQVPCLKGLKPPKVFASKVEEGRCGVYCLANRRAIAQESSRSNSRVGHCESSVLSAFTHLRKFVRRILARERGARSKSRPAENPTCHVPLARRMGFGSARLLLEIDSILGGLSCGIRYLGRQFWSIKIRFYRGFCKIVFDLLDAI